MKKTSKKLFAKFVEALIAVVLVSQFVPQKAILFAEEEAPAEETVSETTEETVEESTEEEISVKTVEEEPAQIYTVVYDFGNKKVEGIKNNEIKEEAAEGSEITLYGSEDVHDNSGKHGLLGWVTESKAVPSSGVVSAEHKIEELVTKDYFHYSGSSYTVNNNVTFYAVWAAKANGTLPPAAPESSKTEEEITPVVPTVPESSKTEEEITPVIPTVPETPEKEEEIVPVVPSTPEIPQNEEEIIPVIPATPEAPKTEEEITPVIPASPINPETSSDENETEEIATPSNETPLIDEKKEEIIVVEEKEETVYEESVSAATPAPVLRTATVVSVPEPKVETLSEAEIGKILPTETITENIAPQAALEGRFALANLLCVAATALLGIATLLAKSESDEDDEEQYRRNRWMKAAAALVFLAGAIVFYLTEDMTLPMTWTDRYTLINAILLAASAVAAYFGLRKNRDEEREEVNA